MVVKWIRKPRFISEDEPKVRKSLFQWTPCAAGQYSLSILGIINGPLPRWFRLVLIVENERSIKLKRKWW